MKKYDLLILGFGKGGKTLAKAASSLGKKVAVVEQSKKCMVAHVLTLDVYHLKHWYTKVYIINHSIRHLSARTKLYLPLMKKIIII